MRGTGERRDEKGRTEAKSLQGSAKPIVKRNARTGVQDQRVEELLAELPVADPRLILLVGAERAVVDENRPRPLKLNVVSAGIDQLEVPLQGAKLDLQVQKRRFLQRRERPLVGV